MLPKHEYRTSPSDISPAGQFPYSLPIDLGHCPRLLKQTFENWHQDTLDPDKPTTWGPDPNPNHPTGQELSEN